MEGRNTTTAKKNLSRTDLKCALRVYRGKVGDIHAVEKSLGPGTAISEKHPAHSIMVRAKWKENHCTKPPEPPDGLSEKRRYLRLNQVGDGTPHRAEVTSALHARWCGKVEGKPL